MRTILRLSRLSRAPSPGSGFGTALLAVALYAPARCVLHWLGLARERRHLARLDDRLLRDIGLTRADVAPEITKPFWRD